MSFVDHSIPEVLFIPAVSVRLLGLGLVFNIHLRFLDYQLWPLFSMQKMGG